MLWFKNDNEKKDAKRGSLIFFKKGAIQIDKKNELRDFTINDYNKMTVNQVLVYDKRSYKQYYWDGVQFSHMVLNAFYVDRNMVPAPMRVISLCFFISFQFALNAIFFSDSYISEKNNLDHIMNNFSFTIVYQLSKSIWSVILGSIPIIMLNPLLKVPESIYKDYNNGLLDYDQESAKKSYYIFLKKMCWRYTLYCFFALLLHFLSWYYVTVFCSVYIKSSINWFYGGLITLFTKFCITAPLLPMIKLSARYFARRFDNT